MYIHIISRCMCTKLCTLCFDLTSLLERCVLSGTEKVRHKQRDIYTLFAYIYNTYMQIHRHFIYKGDTSKRAYGTDPRVCIYLFFDLANLLERCGLRGTDKVRYIQTYIWYVYTYIYIIPRCICTYMIKPSFWFDESVRALRLERLRKRALYINIYPIYTNTYIYIYI